MGNRAVGTRPLRILLAWIFLCQALAGAVPARAAMFVAGGDPAAAAAAMLCADVGDRRDAPKKHVPHPCIACALGCIAHAAAPAPAAAHFQPNLTFVVEATQTPRVTARTPVFRAPSTGPRAPPRA
jgi:hypothetical protein